jgi:hypothetical protein
MELDLSTRRIATIMALAVLLAMPLPDFSLPLHRIFVVGLLWLTCLAWAASCYFRPQWLGMAWGMFTGAAVFQLLILKLPVLLLLSIVWRLWLSARLKRLKISAPVKKVAMILALLSFPGFSAEIPESVKGNKIEAVASCGTIEKIPWVFRRGKRQSRFLIKDRLRLTTQSDFSVWEVHQVLDSSGYLAYVFKRIREDGVVEAIVTKETSYNRILEKGNQRRIAEVRSLKNMVDRPVLTWVTKEGGSINFMPSLGGLARLQINFSEQKNRSVPPVMLVGRNCDRVEDPETKAMAESASDAAVNRSKGGGGGGAAPGGAASP